MRYGKIGSKWLAILLAISLLPWAPQLAASSVAVPRGTVIKLVLKDWLSTEHSKVRDPFTAEVAEDVAVDGHIAIEKGAIVLGEVAKIESPKRLAGIRGQASMVLRFEEIRLRDGRKPLVASLVSVHDAEQSGQNQKVEGEGKVVTKTDTKGMITKGAVGAGAGAVIGAIFGNVSRGLLLGSLGGAVAILAPKGKDVSMPQGTGLEIRLDRDLGDNGRLASPR